MSSRTNDSLKSFKLTVHLFTILNLLLSWRLSGVELHEEDLDQFLLLFESTTLKSKSTFLSFSRHPHVLLYRIVFWCTSSKHAFICVCPPPPPPPGGSNVLRVSVWIILETSSRLRCCIKQTHFMVGANTSNTHSPGVLTQRLTHRYTNHTHICIRHHRTLDSFSSEAAEQTS